MKKKREIPHTYVIVFLIIIFCALMTWIVPGGQYVEQISSSGEKLMLYQSVERVPQTWQIFASLYKGFVDKADIIIFILIIGGSFWIVNHTKAFDVATLSFLKKSKELERNRFFAKIGVNNIVMLSIMLLFSIFGAVFGMSEETIAFIIILVPMAISMGYDSITGVNLVFVAAGLGFAGAVLNPFTIGIAQGLSGLPLFSGIEYRLFCWLIINAFGFTWIIRYANKIKKNPELSIVYQEDAYWRSQVQTESLEVEYSTPKSAWWSAAVTLLVLILFSVKYPLSTLVVGNSTMDNLPILPALTILFSITSFFSLKKSIHLYILNLLFFTIFFLIVGVMGYGWYIMEISALFFGLGIGSGLAANLSANHIVKLFMEGCKDILSAAMVVGLAGGIIAILNDGMIIDTILYHLAQGMNNMGEVATIGMMYLIQNIINLVIPSGSAKAALTMPIMAPFSDLVGISRQATVMAFQFGDGFTNMLTPTSGILIAVLGIAKIPYDKWFKWAWKFILSLIVLGFLLLIPTVLLKMNGF